MSAREGEGPAGIRRLAAAAGVLLGLGLAPLGPAVAGSGGGAGTAPPGSVGTSGAGSERAGERPARGALAGVAWDKRMRAGRRAAQRRAGRVSFSVRGAGVKRSYEGSDRYHSASVVKAMLLVAYLRKYSDRELRDSERERLKIMIRRSHNDAATAVRDEVGNGALEAIAARLGFRCFATDSSWGATEICSRDMALFMKKIEGELPSRHRGFAMTLLKRIVTKQRWGIAEVTRRSGWTPFFKGGWHDYAPGEWRVHQIALLRGPGREELAIAILGNGQPSKKYGITTVRKVARAVIGPLVKRRPGRGSG